MDRRTFLWTAGLAGLWSKIHATMNGDGNKNKKLGIALVGLGNYAMGQLAPALQKTKYLALKGLVSGSPEKLEKYSKQYKVAAGNLYSYENFDDIAQNPDIDIVYIVLPNSMHAEYTIRAAKAKKHVICEKPMAVSTQECHDMIKACQENQVSLSIGYRLHFEPYNLEMKRLGQNRVYGELKSIQTEFSFVASAGIWRLDKKWSGGGPLMDIGIYCLQAGLYISGQQPEYVSSFSAPSSTPEKYQNIEQEIDFKMYMPDGLEVNCRCSYEENSSYIRVETEKGEFGLDPAFNYNSIQGYTPKGKLHMDAVNQQTLQMDAFATSIKTNTPSIVSGEMGLRDLQIITAIYKSMNTGKKIKVDYTL